MNILLDAKSYQLLNKLLKSSNYLTIEQLGEDLNISRRSVYYSLARINDFLESNQLTGIEVERKLGIYLQDSHRAAIQKVIGNVKDSNAYILSPMERVRYISCFIIYLHNKVFVDMLSEQLNVSRNTIFNDLKVVESKLKRYELSIEFNAKTGYQIVGNTINIRAFFLYNFQMLLPLFNSRIVEFPNIPQANLTYYLLKRIEEILNVKYVSGTLFSLSILLQSYIENQEEIAFHDLDAEEIQSTKEYKLVGKYFPMLIASEKIYLTIHLLGARLQSTPIFNKSEEYSREAYEIASDLLFEFERISRLSIKDDVGLLEALSLHLKTSMFRYKYGIVLENPLTDDIVKNYSELFMLTKKACDYFQRRIGLPINDSEIAFLALHFGSFVKETNQKNFRILLVCPNGVATGKMLKYEISKLIPQAQIVDILPSKDVSNVSEICDLVISTVQVISDVPTMIVNPILNNTDRVAILNYVAPMMLSEKKSKFNPDDIIETFQHFVNDDKIDGFKNAVYQYFQGQNNIYNNKNQGILKFLSQDKVSFLNCKNWEETIYEVSSPLLQCNSLTTKYIDCMIDEIKYYGPYNFITDGVVLAHAKPISNETRIDIAVGISEKGILFCDKKKAYVILVLSVDATDNHLNILRDILIVFGVQTNVEQLIALKTKKSVVSFFEEKLAT